MKPVQSCTQGALNGLLCEWCDVNCMNKVYLLQGIQTIYSSKNQFLKVQQEKAAVFEADKRAKKVSTLMFVGTHHAVFRFHVAWLVSLSLLAKRFHETVASISR